MRTGICRRTQQAKYVSYHVRDCPCFPCSPIPHPSGWTDLCAGFRAFTLLNLKLYEDWDPFQMAGNAWRENPKIQSLVKEEVFNQLVADMNAVLAKYTPRHRKAEELLVKLVSKANNEHVDVNFGLHIHKYAGDLAGDAIIEHVLYSVDMIIADGALPAEAGSSNGPTLSSVPAQ